MVFFCRKLFLFPLWLFMEMGPNNIWVQKYLLSLPIVLIISTQNTIRNTVFWCSIILIIFTTSLFQTRRCKKHLKCFVDLVYMEYMNGARTAKVHQQSILDLISFLWWQLIQVPLVKFLSKRMGDISFE